MTFFHRHLPTFTRFTKLIVWKWMHLYFPMAIHFLTDKYEGRIHHLVVDTIYAAFSILLFAANIGLGVWFFFYFTPADVEIRMVMDPSIQSGQKTTVQIQYANYGRRVKNAHLYVTLPDGFTIGGDIEPTEEFVDFSIGDLPEYSNGTLTLPGIVYGNINQTYLLEAEMTYTTLRQQETVVTADRFFINDSAFEISVDVPRAAAYNIPTTYTVHYENTGNGPFDDAKLVTNFPDYFVVQSVQKNGIAQSVSGDTREFHIGRVEAHEKGTLTITGVFSGDVRAVGDQDVQLIIIPYLSVYQQRLHASVEFIYKSFFSLTHVIRPYVTVDVIGDTAETYGNTVDYRVVVKNTSTVPVEHVRIQGALSGQPLLSSLTRINSVRTGSSALTFPEIARLEPQEQTIFTVSIPTTYTTAANQIASLSVSGEAYAPLIDALFDLYGDSLSTRFASRISVSAAALYTGPNGEQLGYGPEHPRAWNITAFRVFLRVDNGNQPVSNVTVKTTLPGMTTWTGSYGTSTGTISYDNSTRTVTWVIPSLPADAKNLGAQFEVRFLPNHLQIGLAPHIVNDIFATAYDPFAGMTVSASHGSVNSEPILP